MLGVLVVRAMAGTTISTFGDPDEYVSALQEAGYRQFLVLQRGPFHARMIRISLRSLRLTRVEECLARTAFLTLAPATIRIVLPPVRGFLVCGGITVVAPHLITHGAGKSICERIDGPGDRSDIVIPSRLLTEYARAMIGTPIVVPGAVRRWRTPAQTLKPLSALHVAAMRLTERRPGEQRTLQAMHGLEQELIGRLVECLSSAHCENGGACVDRGADIIARLAVSMEARGGRCVQIRNICEELGVAEPWLRRYCQRHIGLSPTHYIRLYRLHLVRRSLRDQSGSLSVAQAARRFGFNQMGRFAASYRELFGELPSATLRRSRAESTL
jgi:AraC-like DNA-binding protein